MVPLIGDERSFCTNKEIRKQVFRLFLPVKKEILAFSFLWKNIKRNRPGTTAVAGTLTILRSDSTK
jgi:hypothetical protein